MKQWSNYQQGIFNFVKNPTGSQVNAIVKAVAGSGKTTTIVEALRHAKGSTIFLAFNKAIAEELKARGVNARTFHSLTYSPVLKAVGARTVDTDKTRKIMRDNLTENESKLYYAFLARLLSLGRQAGIDCLIDDTPDTWASLVAHHDLNLDHDDADINTALALASKLLKASNASRLIDFDDLLYLAVRDKVTLPRFDFIFVDEAQDTNAIQRALLKKIMLPTSRLIAVGDPAQAIYGFRGADSDSLDLIAKEFNCAELPLTVSYRCPTSVIALAQEYVSHIEAAPGAPAGEVINSGSKWDMSQFKANDLVVCRTTRHLIALGYSMLKERKAFYIMGRDIGQGLKALINKMNAKDVDSLTLKLNAWREREVNKLTTTQQDAKIEAINDKADAVLFLIDGLTEGARTISALCNIIDSMFNERANATVLATIHKAKGLEANNVFWLNSSQCPAKWARQDWQKQQELNLCYVAVTRAKCKLTLIEEKTKVSA